MLALLLITLLCVSFLAFVYFEVEHLKVELDLYKKLVDSLNNEQAKLNFRIQQLEMLNGRTLTDKYNPLNPSDVMYNQYPKEYQTISFAED